MIMEWFRHFASAGINPRLTRLIMELGNEGYGIYWRLIEKMAHEEKVRLNADRLDELAFLLQVEINTFRGVVELCLREGLLIEEDEIYVYSQRLRDECERMRGVRDELSTVRAEAGRLGGIQSGKVRQDKAKRSKPKQGSANEPDKIREDKIREEGIKSKPTPKDIKKKKEPKKTHLDFVELTEEEHGKLAVQLGAQGVIDYIQKMNDYIGATNKKYASHYFAILKWWRDAGSIKKGKINPYL